MNFSDLIETIQKCESKENIFQVIGRARANYGRGNYTLDSMSSEDRARQMALMPFFNECDREDLLGLLIGRQSQNFDELKKLMREGKYLKKKQGPRESNTYSSETWTGTSTNNWVVADSSIAFSTTGTVDTW